MSALRKQASPLSTCINVGCGQKMAEMQNIQAQSKSGDINTGSDENVRNLVIWSGGYCKIHLSPVEPISTPRPGLTKIEG